jgi:hypothetical protein
MHPPLRPESATLRPAVYGGSFFDHRNTLEPFARELAGLNSASGVVCRNEYHWIPPETTTKAKSTGVLGIEVGNAISHFWAFGEFPTVLPGTSLAELQCNAVAELYITSERNPNVSSVLCPSWPTVSAENK